MPQDPDQTAPNTPDAGTHRHGPDCDHGHDHDRDPATADPFHSHDHAHCAATVLDRAERQAREDGVRLTPVRRRVLEILLESHRAMGAYDVLERLSAEGFGKQPPVAYRALDFLVEQGFAHRVRRLNAYAACLSEHRSHSPAFLICRSCEQVAEADTDSLRETLAGLGRDMGFTVERSTVELLGLCARCAAAGGDAPDAVAGGQS